MVGLARFLLTPQAGDGACQSEHVPGQTDWPVYGQARVCQSVVLRCVRGRDCVDINTNLTVVLALVILCAYMHVNSKSNIAVSCITTAVSLIYA